MDDADVDVATEIKSKLHERTGHVSVLYENSIYVWGGYSETPWRSRRLHQFRYYAPNEVIRLDWFYGYWEIISTTGDIPARAAGSCALEYQSHMYVFGGFVQPTIQDSFENMNLFYKLDLRTMTWELIKPQGQQPVPCDKLCGWVYNNKLYFFGGFGYLPERVPETTNIRFYRDDSTYDSTRPRGWNDQLFCYNPRTNEWEYPGTVGSGPSPRAGHAAAIDNNGNVFVFGGRCVTRNNELHILHMPTMKWITSNVKVRVHRHSSADFADETGNGDGKEKPPMVLNDLSYVEGNAPARRSWHSLTHIGNSRFMLFGGLDELNHVRYDVWILSYDNENSATWTELYMADVWPRFWHKAEYIKSEEEVMVVGGHTIHVSPLNDEYSSSFLIDHIQVQADSLLCFNFGPKSLVRLCLDTVVEHLSEYTEEELTTLPSQMVQVITLKYNQTF